MKITIKQINQQLPDINGVSKSTGKPYTIKHWLCNTQVNSDYIQNVEIKTLEKTFFLECKEYEVEQKIFNNIVSYQLVQEKKSFQKSGYNRVTYTLEEYDALWKHALSKFTNHLEKTPELISTYIISAVNSGVKVESQKQQIQQTEVQQEDPYKSDEDIEF